MAAHELDDSYHLHMAMSTIALLKERCCLLSYMTKKEAMTFQLTDYQMKKESNAEFNSPPIYTGPNGYHLQFKVYVNGFSKGKNTHLSVYAQLLKGKYDAELKWPFVGIFTVTILNQARDRNHYEKAVKFERNDNVVAGTATNALGFPLFISQAELVSKPYLVNDTLYFRVSLV